VRYLRIVLLVLLLLAGVGLLAGTGLVRSAASAMPGVPLADPTPVSLFLPVVQGGSPPAPDARITGFVYEGSDEYLEITNQGTAAQDMTGWWIHSVVGDQKFAFPGGYVLAPGARVRVHSGEAALDNPPGDLLWGYAYVWLNEGDRAVLYNRASQVVDETCYGTGCP
jgi:hypothetical protein